MLFFYDFIILYHLEIHEDSEENMKLWSHQFIIIKSMGISGS
jgi:hypothetical protein